MYSRMSDCVTERAYSVDAISQMLQNNGFDILTCLNSCAQEPQVIGKNLKSTKNDNGFHGLGIKSIQNHGMKKLLSEMPKIEATSSLVSSFKNNSFVSSLSIIHLNEERHREILPSDGKDMICYTRITKVM